MFGSIRLGTILGIPVGANWSVLFIAWLIAWSLAGQLLPAQVPGLEPTLYWAAGAISAVLFLASLLAHEMAHAVVARREGLKVSGITLWLLGGVARMDGEARSPGAEARIAGIGPATSLGLAIAFGAASAALAVASPGDLVTMASVASAWLAFVNLVLAVFNLLPGAPLDGGRIARAVIWRLRGDKLQATRWSTGLGQVLGYGLVGVGLVRAVAGDLGGIWFVLLGFFLSSAASAERQSAVLLDSLQGIRVGEIMEREPLRVPGGLTVDTFASAAAGHGRASTWLVTGPGGSVVGLLGLDALRTVRGDDRRSRRIGELAVPPTDWPTAEADELVVDVLQRLGGTQTRAVVRDRDDVGGEIVGLLSPEDISRTIADRQAGIDHHRRSSRGDDANQGRVLP